MAKLTPKERGKQWMERHKRKTKDEVAQPPLDHQKGIRGNCYGLLRNLKTGKARPDWTKP